MNSITQMMWVFLLTFPLVTNVCLAQGPSNISLIELLTPRFEFPNEIGSLIFSPSLLRAAAPITMRASLLYAIVQHEVSAGCHPKALSFLGQREPIEERFCSSRLSILLMRNQLNYRLWQSEFPLDAEPYGRFLYKLGLKPYDKTISRSTERGWSNAVANKLVAFFANDGWNSQGELSKTNYQQYYQDYTGYKPINRGDLEPHQLLKPLRWQPLTRASDFRGKFETQVHITPQLGVGVQPLALTKMQFEERIAPPPYRNPNNIGILSSSDKSLAGNLIEKLFNLSRKTTLDDVIISHWWENKFVSLGSFLTASAATYSLDSTKFSQIYLTHMIAQHDALLVAFREKLRHDLVRPPTLIRHLIPKKKVVAFRGIGKGIGEVAAEDWEPILGVQPHSEYPSASSILCTAALEALETSLKVLALGDGETIAPFKFTIRRRPNFFVPIAREVNVAFPTIEEAVQSCGHSRLASGVHFEPSVPAGRALGRGIGEAAFRHVQDLYNGKVPNNCVRCL